MKTWNKIILGIAGLLAVVVGVLMMVYPLEAMQGISWLIGLLTLLSGCAILVFFFSGVYLLFGSSWVLLDGIATVAVGILFLCQSNALAGVLPYIFGIWLFIMGVQELVASLQFHHFHISQWWVSLLLGIVIMVLGFLCCWQPIAGSHALAYLMGIGVILFGISLLVTLGRINAIQKTVKSFFKELDVD
jgi:uncharacterized membrane protein HdeD (DUF308 family)